MTPRLNLFEKPTAAKALGQFGLASKVLMDATTLPTAVQRLVMLRVSQVNGCGYATDVWSKEALAAGEDPVRVCLVAAWRESTVFTDAERAALAVAEEGTRIADAAGGVADATWATACEHFDEDQLAELVVLIALINATNRMGVVVRTPGGAYRAGQFATSAD